MRKLNHYYYEKVILFFFIALISLGNIKAQTSNSLQNQDLKVSIDSLSTKLSSLQHDYDYLYCSYLLSEAQLTLKDFMNELSIKSNAILNNYYHSEFDIDLYNAYSNYYNSCIEFYESTKEKAEYVTTSVAIIIMTSNFTENEINILGQSSNLVDDYLRSAQNSLDYYKGVLDVYQDLR